MEKEFDKYLGGAPREAVEEFPRTQGMKQSDELSEDELMGVIGGVDYEVALEHQLDKTSIFPIGILHKPDCSYR